MKLFAVAHLVALASIFIVSVAAFLRFSDSPLLQLYTVIASVLAYVGWGITYHFLDKHLTLSIIVEYLLVGALVILLFFWTLFS